MDRGPAMVQTSMDTPGAGTLPGSLDSMRQLLPPGGLAYTLTSSIYHSSDY